MKILIVNTTPKLKTVKNNIISYNFIILLKKLYRNIYIIDTMTKNISQKNDYVTYK